VKAKQRGQGLGRFDRPLRVDKAPRSPVTNGSGTQANAPEIRFRNSGTIIPAGIFDQDKGVREEREMGKVLLLVMAISVAALIGITAFIIQL
jgi:hypothetical protein